MDNPLRVIVYGFFDKLPAKSQEKSLKKVQSQEEPLDECLDTYLNRFQVSVND